MDKPVFQSNYENKLYVTMFGTPYMYIFYFLYCIEIGQRVTNVFLWIRHEKLCSKQGVQNIQLPIYKIIN